MAHVEIYTKPLCGYCRRAKNLLNQEGVEFEEIDLSEQPGREKEMIRRAQGRRTVPQIFINDQPVGGSDDLAVLVEADKLDQLLNQQEDNQ